MVVRVHLILVGVVFLGMVDRLNAEPYPDSFLSSRSSSQVAESQRGDSPTEGHLQVAHLLANAQLQLGIPSCGGWPFQGAITTRSMHETSWDGGGGEAAGVAEIPPLPGSAELFLSAIMGMGAWHLTRQSLDLRLGAWSSWYQTGEPSQVRHMVAFDVRFEAAPLSPMQSAVRLQRRWYVRTRLDRPRLSSEWADSVIGSRAPPLESIRHI